MGSDALAAELTLASLNAKNEQQRRLIWKEYDEYAEKAVASLHMMNQARRSYAHTSIPLLIRFVMYSSYTYASCTRYYRRGSVFHGIF